MPKFIEIANFQFSTEAYILKSKLENEGIPVFLQNENTINSDPMLSMAVGGVKLLVENDDVIKAKKIINGIPEYITDANGVALCCANCGAQKITLKTSATHFKTFLGMLPALLFGSLPFYAKHIKICEDCLTEYKN